MSADNYLAVADFARAREEVDERVMSLVDGRSIRVRHAPAPDGGWTSTHEDITELHEKRLLLEERLSLQSLIDATPDNLWVKDTQNRFVIANVVTARRMGRLSPKELIGKSDLEMCPPETAEKYLADERDILTTGRQLIDAEEFVLSPEGAKTWIATTKTPLRNERGEIIGIVGISRTSPVVAIQVLAPSGREYSLSCIDQLATRRQYIAFVGEIFLRRLSRRAHLKIRLADQLLWT